MIRRFPLCTAAAALALALTPLAEPGASAAQAPDAAVTDADTAYGDLYKAMQQSVDQRLMVEGALAALQREFASAPEFAEAEAESPGLIAEVIAGLRPIFEQQSVRVQRRYRPSTLALFARHLTPADAASIADFYRSGLGRKLMAGVSQSFSPDAMLSNIHADTPVTREQVQADIGRAAGAAMATLTQDDMVELGRMAQANPAIMKLSLIGAGVQELRVEMENEPLTAEEDAAVVAVVEDVFNRRFPPE